MLHFKANSQPTTPLSSSDSACTENYIQQQLILSIVNDDADRVQPLLQSISQQDGKDALRVSQLLQLAIQNGSFQVASVLASEPKMINKPCPKPQSSSSTNDSWSSLDPTMSSASCTPPQGVWLLRQESQNMNTIDNQLLMPDLLEEALNNSNNQFGLQKCAVFSELEKEEYCTDYFRMYEFKVAPCSRKDEHDYLDCPYAHEAEKACRRDPTKFNYVGTACPDFRKGSCKRGDACGYAHGVFECWLHPSRYRTQLCQDGMACTRKVCFFAHHLQQLRAPEHQPFKGHSSTTTTASTSTQTYTNNCLYNYNNILTPNPTPNPNPNPPPPPAPPQKNFTNAQLQRLTSLCSVLQQLNMQQHDNGQTTSMPTYSNNDNYEVQSGLSDTQVQSLNSLRQVLQQLSLQQNINGILNNPMHGCNYLQGGQGGPQQLSNSGGLFQNGSIAGFSDWAAAVAADGNSTGQGYKY